MERPLLLLTADQFRLIGTVAAHIDAFKAHSRYRVVQLDAVAAAQMDISLGDFAAVIVHYSVIASNEAYLPPSLRDRLAEVAAPKILLIQDEMRWVRRTEQTILDLGFSAVFSVTPPHVQRELYPRAIASGVRFETTLTGFVEESLNDFPVPNYDDRRLDVVYRARKLSAFYGAFAQEKWRIGERFARDAARFGLKCDISSRESDRVYGREWLRFLGNAKATLGVESGASFMDFSGEVLPRVEAYERENPSASFEKVRDLFLEGRDGDVVISVISPRCFEAASLRTLMIMYEGEYSGVLEPWKHYAVLERDHSNMAEIAELLRDSERARAIIEAAYRDIACSDRWTYAAFIRHFDQVLGELLASSRPQAHSDGLSDAAIAELERTSRELCRQRVRRQKMVARLSSAVSRGNSLARRVLPHPVYVLIKRLASRSLNALRPAIRKFAGLG